MKRLLCPCVIAAGAALVLGLAAGSPVAVAATAPAQACKQWSVTGAWKSAQSNRNYVTYRFVQKHNQLTGTAIQSPAAGVLSGFRNGTLSGALNGDHIHYVVVWERSKLDGLIHRGKYTATVSQGAIIGQTRDLTVHGAPVSFTAHGPAKCTTP